MTRNALIYKSIYVRKLHIKNVSRILYEILRVKKSSRPSVHPSDTAILSEPNTSTCSGESLKVSTLYNDRSWPVFYSDAFMII